MYVYTFYIWRRCTQSNGWGPALSNWAPVKFYILREISKYNICKTKDTSSHLRYLEWFLTIILNFYIFAQISREGVKKAQLIVAHVSANGGGVSTLAATKIVYFFYLFLYILDHSGSFVKVRSPNHWMFLLVPF